MTDLQDQILDHLVGSRVAADWPGGPLDLAAGVVGGTKPVQFGQTDNDRGAKAEIARRLGYPVLLCEAIQGGARGLGEADRRGFAMTVFRSVPVGGKLLKFPSLDQTRIAGRLAVRAHGYVCPDGGCAVPKMLVELLPSDAIPWARAQELRMTACATIGQLSEVWRVSQTTTHGRLATSAIAIVSAFESGTSVHGWCSARESVRLAASERGPEEAVACCLAVARECGLGV